MRHNSLQQQLFRLATAAALLVLLPGGAPAQAQTTAFGETADVVVVEIPVQVVRDGQPVRGLTAADFEVYEGRKKQEITGFEMLDLTAPAAGGAAGKATDVVPAAARRHFLLMFDLSNSEPRAMVKARDAAKGILGQLHPTDLVAVATYSSKGPQLSLGFTPDRRQVELAVDTLGLPELMGRSADPLKLMATDYQALMAQHGAIGGADKRDMNSEAINEYLQNLASQEKRADLDARRNQVAAFTRSIADLAKLMGSVTGRKYVVYLSEGFDSSILTGSSGQSAMDELTSNSPGNPEEGALSTTTSEERFGDTRAVNALEKMLEELRRADCVVQSVDIGGLRAGSDLGYERKGGTETLLTMAKDTGGDLFQNFNNLGEAMDQMLARTGVTYVLSFQPDKLKRDGVYHKLRIELKNQPRGTRLLHRPGYYAPKPFAEQNPFERLLQAANQVASGEDAGTLPTAVIAAPFHVGGDKAYVPVVVEVPGPALLAGAPKGAPLPAEVYVYALDGTGAVHDFLTQTVGLDLAKVEGALRQGGFKFFGHLDLQPGEYSVRVLVRNGATGASGLRIVPVTVPAFGQAKPVLLPPFFPEAPGKWLMVREAPRGDKPRDVPYPFMQKQQPYIPASLPILTPGQETPLALIGYHLDGDLQAAARITSKDGKEAGNGEIRLLEREAGTPVRVAAVFRPPNLAPGEYWLTVRLTGAAGTVETAASPFKVGGGAARGTAK
ncbi:MAG TPA: VWA domain-containing protein [Thermoanaerobaculia bacterium]|nr:VWA domain-containing protein [Thermoanaerobaculia bacterium]